MSESHSTQETPLICPGCRCRLFEATFVSSRYLHMVCYQCSEGLLFAINLAAPVEVVGPDWRTSAPRLVEPETGLLTLSVKGTAEEAIHAAEEHGVTVTIVHEANRPKGASYVEGLCSAAYGEQIKRWYASQNHSVPYGAGALLWWRTAERKEVAR